jgi:hypothetical protein
LLQQWSPAQLNATSEKEDFLEMFYTHYMGWLVQPFASPKLATQSAGTVKWQAVPEGPLHPSARPAQLGPLDLKPGSMWSGGVGVSHSSRGFTHPSMRCCLSRNAEVIEPPKRQLVFAPFPSQGDGSALDIGKEPYTDKNVKLLIIDLLCVWVRSHTYRFKYFLLRNNLCVKILRVLRYRESHIVLGNAVCPTPCCCCAVRSCFLMTLNFV